MSFCHIKVLTTQFIHLVRSIDDGVDVDLVDGADDEGWREGEADQVFRTFRNSHDRLIDLQTTVEDDRLFRRPPPEHQQHR